MQRRCIVCGKKITIHLYPDRHYHGGHYFRKMKIPIGKGKYKKIGSTKLGKKKVDVVKWTGKEKEIEYWECEACYSEAVNENWLEEIIEKLYGKRCPDFEKGCGCCNAWSVYDMIIDANRGRI